MIWPFIQKNTLINFVSYWCEKSCALLYSEKKMKWGNIGGELNTDSHAKEVYATFELRCEG
jgi:hypothetical protein